MEVDISASITGEFNAGIPKLPLKVLPGVAFWQVANDGQRFLIPVAGGTASANPAPYKVVLNWTSLLKH